MEEDLPVKSGVTIPGGELWFTASRSGGPGGQHVNKTSSRVTLHWDASNTLALGPDARARLLSRLASRLTGEGLLQVHVDDTRSQYRNREIARDRLAQMLLELLKPRKKRVKTKPSLAAKHRRVEQKRRRAQVKQQRTRPGKEDG